MAGLTTIPKVTQLTSRIIRVLGCNPGKMTLQGTNTYIIGTGKKRILLDAGEPNIPEYITSLQNVLQTNNIQISDIVITHWHRDHIGGVEEIFKNKLCDEKECSVWKYPRSDSENQSKQSNYELTWLQPDQKIIVEGATLKMIHTPGHTTDHMIGLLLEENAIFSGDCILGEGTTVFEDLYTYMKSLNLILELNSDVIYPGHGNIINDPATKIKFYIEHRNKRESQILDLINQNPEITYTAFDIVKHVYQTTPENLWPAAALNVSHHLEKLSKENRIISSGEGYKSKPQINKSCL